MNSILRKLLLVSVVGLGLSTSMAFAREDADTTRLFRDSHESASYFAHSYGYAVFPTIGKGGLGVGAAHGTGDVYRGAKRLGSVSMTQLSIGLQAGGEAYSEIIFFENKRALDEFTSGHFEFSGDVGAIVITAAATASVGTTGGDAGASVDKREASTVGGYHKGMAVFTIAKGGLMYNATIAGQKFTFRPGDSASN